MKEQTLNEARGLISLRFANRRKELGLSQEKAAELSGLGIATIKRFESARFWIGLKQLVILCEIYGCDILIENKIETPTVEN